MAAGGDQVRIDILGQPQDLARAIAARPRILLYDEPTTGLDPITALSIDAEIIKLRDIEHVSSIIVTHQLRDVFYVATHEARPQQGEVAFIEATPEKLEQTEFLMLRDGRIAFEGSAEELRAAEEPYLKAFVSGVLQR